MKNKLIKLSIDSNQKLPTELEQIVCIEKDAMLRAPGSVAHYYRFFYFLAKLLKPSLTVELGTSKGISSACLAAGNPEGKVITINKCNELLPECRMGNVAYLLQDSRVPVDLPRKIDILYIDTEHNGIICQEEYDIWKSLMSPGGIVFFDDIHLSKSMDDFWAGFNPAEGEKFELPVHGEAGFGVVLFAIS